MYDLSKDYSNSIQTVRLEIGDLLGMERKEDVFIILAEPDTFDCMKLNKVFTRKDDDMADELFDQFAKLFGKLIVDHNIMNGDRKAKAEEVKDLVFRKLSISSYVLDEYMTKVFHSPQSKTEEK